MSSKLFKIDTNLLAKVFFKVYFCSYLNIAFLFSVGSKHTIFNQLLVHFALMNTHFSKHSISINIKYYEEYILK